MMMPGVGYPKAIYHVNRAMDNPDPWSLCTSTNQYMKKSAHAHAFDIPGLRKYRHRERVKEILSRLESKGASVVRYEGYLRMTFVMDLRIMSYKYR
jgi:hypothetical protein